MDISYCQTLRATCETGVNLSVFPKIESLRDLTKTAQLIRGRANIGLWPSLSPNPVLFSSTRRCHFGIPWILTVPSLCQLLGEGASSGLLEVPFPCLWVSMPWDRCAGLEQRRTELGKSIWAGGGVEPRAETNYVPWIACFLILPSSGKF